MTVSIIIPVYNVADYIERCIRSVMNQTYSDIECIIVDDASPDDSIAIAERHIAEYAGPIRFHILHHKYNRGLSVARNTGIDAAMGDYIFFLDSDDEITPDCIEKLTKPILEDAIIEMVQGCHVGISNSKEGIPSEHLVLTRQEELTTQEAARDFYYARSDRYMYSWNKLIQRAFILDNQLHFKEGLLWEDLLWLFLVVKHLNHLFIVPDVTYRYYKRPNSITTSFGKKEKTHSIGLALAEIVNTFTLGNSQWEAKRFIKGFCLHYLYNPTNPLIRDASRRYLKVLKSNLCFKEWLLLKATIIFSKFPLGRSILLKTGKILKSVIKKKRAQNRDNL